MRLAILAASVVVAAAPAALGAAAPQLFGTVGPDFSIKLADASGAAVTKVDPGTYEVEVRDLSDFHNFRLAGPGVEQTTGVEETGTFRWTVTFANGTYTLLCEVHPSSMRRTFVSGTPPVAPPPAAPTRLLATVGPKATIGLRSATGARLRSLKPGRYAIVVRDRTKRHNFHLVAPGTNRKTGVAAVTTTTWRVTLRAGTLRFFSDKAPKTLKGSIPVR